MTNKIENPHPDYENINKHSTNSIILMGGSIAMRESKIDVLPQNQYESDKNYTSRVNRSVLLNTYKTTLDNLSNKPFQEPVKWSDELPEKLKFIVNNIDGSGTSQDAFFKSNVSDSLQFGKHIYLVNMPNIEDENGIKINEIDRAKLNLNPFVSRVQPDSLINWFYGSDKSLDMIKIQYKVEELNGGEVEQVKKIDLWNREYIETWRQVISDDSSEEWVLESTSPNGLGKITLVIGNDLYDLPTLENLAELNMLHYSKASDKDNNIHMSLTPFLEFLGYDKDDTAAVISVYNAYVNDNTNASIKWVELTGEGITLAIEDLKNLESQMNAYGNDVITPQVAKTATEKKIDNDDKMSTLQSIVVDVETSAAIMLSLMAEWLGLDDPQLKLEIFKDFNATDQALEELKLLQKDYLNDAITAETYLKELIIRKVIKSKDFNIKEELIKIETMKAIMNFGEGVSETNES